MSKRFFAIFFLGLVFSNSAYSSLDQSNPNSVSAQQVDKNVLNQQIQNDTHCTDYVGCPLIIGWTGACCLNPCIVGTATCCACSCACTTYVAVTHGSRLVQFYHEHPLFNSNLKKME